MRKQTFFLNLSAFIIWISILAFSMILLASMNGCSAVQEISDSTGNIDKLSQSSEDRFVKIADISTVKEVDKEAEEGIIEQQEIQNSVSNIRQALPRVEDKSPSWMTLFERGSIVLILIAIIILLWQTGIGSLVRSLLYSVKWFIPRKSMRDAEMDMKIADADHEMTIREAIASKRASDKAYDSAYKKLKQGK